MARNHVFHCCQKPFWKLLLSVGIWTILNMIPNYSFSQIPPPVTIDGSLQGLAGSGNNSGAQALSSQDITVTREMGLVRGSNLFHSFGRFNVPTDGSVTFTGPSSIINILSRVTGNDVSNIDGTLRSEINGANFFLMNPQGIIFGPNASLNITGSFYATTANNIELAEEVLFNAVPDQLADDLLTSAPPEAFGFLDNHSPSPITVQAGTSEAPSLKAPAGKRLVFVSGDFMAIGKDFSAPGGQIILTSVAGVGESFEVIVSTGAPTQNISFGQVKIQNSTIDSSGDLAFENGSGGPVIIRGGQLEVTDSLLRTATPEFEEPSTGRSGAVTIQGAESFSFTNSRIDTQTFFGGGAGQVTITAGEAVSLADSSIITDDIGIGQGGQVTIGASTVTLFNTTITSDAAGPGIPELKDSNAGNIEFNVDRLTLTGSSQISSRVFEGSGVSGTISVNATEDLTISASGQGQEFVGLIANSQGQGEAGTIEVNTKQLTLREGGQIASDTTGPGEAGTIKIVASENFTIEAQSNTGLPSALRATNGEGLGNAGTIEVETGKLVIIGGGQIRSDAFGDGGGGKVTIAASDSITITGQDSGVFTTSEGTGLGGDVTLIADEVAVSNEGTILASSELNQAGAGNAGNITLEGRNSILVNFGTVRTRAENAFGGKIKLISENLIQINNSQITSNVQEGSGDAGSINIDPQFIVVQNSLIDTSADEGGGGNVTFVAGSAILIDPFSRIDTSSQFGGSGTIDIRAPIQNLGETIAPLPEEILKVSALFAARCAAQKEGRFSSFIPGGRDGLPPEPNSFLASPIFLEGSTSAKRVETKTMLNPITFPLEFERVEWKQQSRMVHDEGGQGCSKLRKTSWSFTRQ